jgi:ribulose-5-phosphate 4-epimerase/fuculose-1-phosphate aldolase
VSGAAEREAIVRAGERLARRGLAPGSSGNISVAVADGLLLTPTARSLGELEAAGLSLVDTAGRHVDGENPTKEHPLHLALYAARPGTRAVVHLHSTSAVAVSCLIGLDSDDALPPITPYQVMRLGAVRVVPYAPPGSSALGELIRDRAAWATSFLLENHGPIVVGGSLDEAVGRAEELEEAARVFLMLGDRSYRRLSDEQVAELEARFRPPGSS